MNGKVFFGLMLILILTSALSLSLTVHRIKAQLRTIYIRADGRVEPETAPISTSDNITYVFVSNIIDNSIVVERSGITIDGLDYSLTTSLDITYGLVLSQVARVTVKNMSIRGFWRGIRLYNSFNNVIAHNNISDNSETGIELSNSPNNSFNANIIANNGKYGINFMSSSGNILRNNNFTGNKYNLELYGSEIQDIDETNTINGKPVYYLVNRKNMEVPSNAGFIALINCDNITVKGTQIESNSIGILLNRTTNSKIMNNNVSGNLIGIYLYESSGNVIQWNNITNNEWGGVWLRKSHENKLYENVMSYNSEYAIELSYSSWNYILGNKIKVVKRYGIYLEYSHYNNIIGNSIKDVEGDGIDTVYSSYNNFRMNGIVHNGWGQYGGRGLMITNYSNNNTFSENNIIDNRIGIELFASSSYNTIAHNNVVNNTQQVELDYNYGKSNTWSYGYPSGGNFWSDYAYTDFYSGSDQNEPGSDGIGDVPVILNMENIDMFPLMAPLVSFDAGIWNGEAYYVNAISNSTVSSFYFNPKEGALIKFDVTGDNGTTGFCRVTIPKSLLWAEDRWTIKVNNDMLTKYTEFSDDANTYLYFTYNHSTKTVIIQGTHVIPEFSSASIMLLILVLSVIAIVWAKNSKRNIT